MVVVSCRMSWRRDVLLKSTFDATHYSLILVFKHIYIYSP
jgi:hypothetical protein